jgi:hypothetical protein
MNEPPSQASIWKALLQRIPPARQDILVLVTSAGIELMVKKIVRFDDDFVVVRGRLAGSSDQHRIAMLPYEHIDNIAFSVLVPDQEIHAIFGDEAQAAPAPEEETALSAAGQTPGLADSPKADPAGGPVPVPPQPKLSKSVLLARLRARLGGDPSRRT